MAQYELLVTDITNFGDRRCVAGWDIERGKMIRPEPHPGGFWPAIKTGPRGVFELGRSVSFEARKPFPPTKLPHLTEDRVVVVGSIAKGPAVHNKNDITRTAAFDSLDALFERNLVIDGQKAYVPVGAKCRSLGGLIVPSTGLSVERYRNYEGKSRLRIGFRADGHYFAPNLTSTRAYEISASGELDKLNRTIAGSSEVLLRIGLARGFPAYPNRCYLQVNGLTVVPKEGA